MMNPDRGERPTVLITGMSGRIGTRTVHALAPEYHVIGLDRNPPSDLAASVDFIACDLTSERQVREALEQVGSISPHIASVIHLAAYYDFSGESSPMYEELTVAGTRRLLDGLSALTVDQFVFSSSMLVMQPSSDGKPIDEDSELAAEWDYPRSKIEAETVIAGHRSAIPAVVLRIAGVYDDACHSIPLAQQARRIHERKLESYLFPGNPEHGQAMVHVDDVAECIRRAVDARDRLGPWEVFLVGEPETMSYGELQDRMGEIIHGRQWPTIRIPAPVAKAGSWLRDKLSPSEQQFVKPWMIDLADADYPLDVSRAAERLGWRPRHRLADELEGMLRGLRQDPAGWYATNGLTPPDGERLDEGSTTGTARQQETDQDGG